VSASRLVVRNVASNWLSLAVGVVSTLLLTPIVVRALGAELYGAWSFLNGLVAYSDLLYVGLGSALIRYVAEARAQGDGPRINRLTSVVVSIYAAIGTGCFLVLLVVSHFVPRLFANGLPPNSTDEAAWACLLLGVRLVLVFVASAFSGLLCGFERFDLANGVSMVSTVIRFVATYLIVPHASEPLAALAVVTCAAAVIEVVGLVAVAFVTVPGLVVRPARPHRGELGVLYRFGLQSFFVLLAFKLISYTDMTVIGMTIGASGVALYVLPLQIVEYARLGVGGFSGVFLPRVTALAADGDWPGLRRAYVNSTRMSAFLAGWMGALVMTLGPAFLTRWVGPEFGSPSPFILLWLVIGAFSYAVSTQAPYPFFQAVHRLGRPALVLTIEAFVNLGLSLWLARVLGITGVALATAIPAVLISATLLPRYASRILQLPFGSVLTRGVGPGVTALVVVAAAEWSLSWAIGAPTSYVALSVRALASIPLGALVFVMTFPADQRMAIAMLAREMTRRR
jgi:O-antigen/teichoic acid export membrane protein